MVARRAGDARLAGFVAYEADRADAGDARLLERDRLGELVVGVGEFNEGYLDAKRDRMGHALPTHDVLDEVLQSSLEGNS